MITTLHIPMDKSIKEQAEIVVKKQGYSSLQEVLRVMVTSLARGEIKTALIHINKAEQLTSQEEHILQ